MHPLWQAPKGVKHPALLHLYCHAMELSPTPERAVPAADAAPVIAVAAEFGADGKNRRQDSGLEQAPCVIVDPVFETCVTRHVDARQIVDHDGRTVRHDDSRPDDERA